MTRSRLCNNVLRNRAEDNRILYNRQKITVYLFCENRIKGTIVKNLNLKEITDNTMFWKTIKPLLSDKSCIRDGISISQKQLKL